MNSALQKKIRVGVDARPLSYGVTGNSRYLQETLQHLVRDDSIFEYILFSNKPIDSIFNSLFTEYGLSPATISPKVGMLWLNFEIPKLLKSFNIDIFWGTLQLLPMFKQPIPCVVNYHDLNFVSAPKTMHKANYWQHKFLSRFTLTNADKIFCLSENTKNEIQAYRPWIKDKLKVVYPGVTKNSDTTIGNSYNKYLFTIGTLEPRKNLQTLLNAYLNIKKDNPDYPYSLVMAGRLGWGEATLTEKLRNGAYKEQGVEFIENPDEKNLISLYKNCVAFLFSSKHEGFGLPLLEAMAEDKICIASDIPVFREILDVQKDILVPPMDIKAWENALNEIGKRSRNDLQRTFDMNKWSWKNTSNLIEEELISLTKKN